MLFPFVKGTFQVARAEAKLALIMPSHEKRLIPLKYPNLLGGWVRFVCNNTEPEGVELRGFFHLANFPTVSTLKYRVWVRDAPSFRRASTLYCRLSAAQLPPLRPVRQGQ